MTGNYTSSDNVNRKTFFCTKKKKKKCVHCGHKSFVLRLQTNSQNIWYHLFKRNQIAIRILYMCLNIESHTI